MACKGMTRDLIDLVYGEIAEETRRRLEDHMRTCEACRHERARMREASAALRRYAEADPVPEPGRLVLATPARRRRWRRPLAGAAAIAATLLVALALSNTRVRRDANGWTMTFSLLSRPATAQASAEGAAGRLRTDLPGAHGSEILSLLDDRLADERRRTEDLLEARLQAEREQTLEAFARALARQEQVFTAGLRNDREELLRRDRAVEELVGSEINRTHQMLGALLATARPAVVEQ